jgi:hypothetical protein
MLFFHVSAYDQDKGYAIIKDSLDDLKPELLRLAPSYDKSLLSVRTSGFDMIIDVNHQNS